METPVQIVFHDVSHSQALEALIRERAQRLGAVFQRLTRCHVSIERPHRRKQQGSLFNVRVTLHVPGGELVVNRDENEDVYVAVRDAFDAARRQLETHAQKVRSEFKRGAAGRQAPDNRAGEDL